MDHTERSITVVDRVYDHADRDQVIHLVHAAIRTLHFAIYAVQMLRPPADRRGYARILQLNADLPHCLVQNGFAFVLALVKLLLDRIVFLRHQVHKG